MTDPNGEIIVLDSAGYGPVVVGKSVTIAAPGGVYGGISVLPSSPNQTGVTVNGPGIIVVLRNLQINGLGGTTGIRLVEAAELHVENCQVTNLAGNGIHAPPQPGGARLFVSNTTVRGNAGSGVLIGNFVFAVLDGMRIERNGTTGDDAGALIYNGGDLTVLNSTVAANLLGIHARVDNGSTIAITVDNSSLSGNQNGGMRVSAVQFSTIRGNLSRSQISNSGGAGAFLDIGFHATGSLLITDSVIGGNSGGGVRATASSSDEARLQVRGGSVAGNSGHGVFLELMAGTTNLVGSLSAVAVSANFGAGLRVDGAASADLSGVTLFGNGAYGVQLTNGGSAVTRGNNDIRNNTPVDVSGGPLTSVPPE